MLTQHMQTKCIEMSCWSSYRYEHICPVGSLDVIEDDQETTFRMSRQGNALHCTAQHGTAKHGTAQYGMA